MAKDKSSSGGSSSGGGIHIKPSHEGRLHEKLGVAEDKPIPTSRLKDEPGDSAALAKEKNFARNAKKWKH